MGNLRSECSGPAIFHSAISIGVFTLKRDFSTVLAEPQNFYFIRFNFGVYSVLFQFDTPISNTETISNNNGMSFAYEIPGKIINFMDMTNYK